MKKWMIGLLTASTVVSAQADTVNFTGNEGYVDGADVTAHADWAGNSGNVLEGVTATTGGAHLSDVNWKGNIYNTAQVVGVGDTISASIDFTFDSVASTADTKNDAIGITINDGPNNTSSSRARIDRRNNDNVEQWRLELGLDGSSVQLGGWITNSELGLNADGSGSTDDLTLFWSLTRGATDNDWATTVALYNDGTLVDSQSWSGLTASANHSGGSLYAGFNSSTSTAGISNKVVDSFTVIPEPATLGLVGAFGGAILFIRRRFMI